MAGFASESLGYSEAANDIGGTVITASATANTKGSWTQIGSATTRAHALAQICIDQSSAEGLAFLVDIGIDPAGGTSYSTILSNAPFTHNSPASSSALHANKTIFMMPCNIPAGATVAARCQCSTGSGAVDVYLELYAGESLPVYDFVEAIGVSAATSLMTTVSAGNDTKGSWAQLTASTSRDYDLVIPICMAELSVTAATNDDLVLDFGIKVSAVDYVLVRNLKGYSAAGTDHSVVPPLWFPVHIPAGSEVEVRAAGTSTTPSDICVALLGFQRSEW